MITPAHAFFNWTILRKWFSPWWVVAGSVLPDLPPFAAFFYLLAVKGINTGNMGGFFGFVMANGNPNRQPGFVEASFLLHSLTLCALAWGAFFLWRRGWMFSLWAGWALHVVGDYLTHVSDAYAPLYPFFMNWRPSGIVSYWQPEYGAGIFSVIQLSAAALALVWILGKRFWMRSRASGNPGAVPPGGSQNGRKPGKRT